MGARSRWEAQSPPAQPHQEGVTETLVSVEMGASKTVPPAPTRGETLPSKEQRLITNARQAISRQTVPPDLIHAAGIRYSS